MNEKAMCAPNFRQRRCVIPAIGFYEWDGEKRRRYFVGSDGAPLFLCGFFRTENDENRFIIMTKQATSPVSEYHDRIPVIAEERQIDAYLNDFDFARSFVTKPAPVALSLA